MNKTNLLKLVVLVVVLVGAIGISFAMFSTRKTYIPVEDEFDKVANAYIQSTLLSSYESDQEIKYEVVDLKVDEQNPVATSYAKLMKDLFGAIKVNLKTKKTVENNKDKYQIIADVIVDNSSFVKLDMYIDNTMIVFQLPGIYDNEKKVAKKVYLKWVDINKVIKKIDPSIKEEINIDDYTKLFTPENLGKLKNVKGMEYYTVVKNDLKLGLINKGKAPIKLTENDREATYNCENFELTIKQKDMLKLVSDMVNKILTDENIKGFTKDKVNEVVDLLIKNQDYKLLNAKEEDIKKFKDDFNKDFDKKYEEMVKNAKAEMDKSIAEINTQTPTDSTVRYTFSIDGDNNIRRVEAEQLSKTNEITLKMMVNGTIANPNRPVKIIAPEIKDEMNLAEMTDAQYQEMAQQIGMSIGGEAMKKPTLQKILGPMMGLGQPSATTSEEGTFPQDGDIELPDTINE